MIPGFVRWIPCAKEKRSGVEYALDSGSGLSQISLRVLLHLPSKKSVLFYSFDLQRFEIISLWGVAGPFSAPRSVFEGHIVSICLLEHVFV